jgi:hypothetical protein
MTNFSGVRSSADMDYFLCRVVLVRGVQDELGMECGRYAKTLCYDCGTSLCSAHAERCELCNETFCPSCLSFHQSEHSKPAQRDQITELPKKKTA